MLTWYSMINIGLAFALYLSYILLTSVKYGFTVLINFNKFGEGWVELGIATYFCVCCFVQLGLRIVDNKTVREIIYRG